MTNLCEEAGLPKPEFYCQSSGVWAVFQKDIYNAEYLQKLGLNDRQVKVVLYAKSKGKITNSEYQKINDCSRNTASNDLMELVGKNIMKSSGQRGAGAFYTLR